MAKLTEAEHLKQTRKALLALRGLNRSVHTAERVNSPSRGAQSRETALQSERRTLIASRPSKKRVDVLIVEQRASKAHKQEDAEFRAAVALRRRRTDLSYADMCEDFEAAQRGAKAQEEGERVFEGEPLADPDAKYSCEDLGGVRVIETLLGLPSDCFTK